MNKAHFKNEIFQLNRASLKDSSFQNFRKGFSYNERILTLTKILKYEHLWAVLATGKKTSFKSAPKVVFTLYKGAAGSLELAQKLKVVKNFEKKKILEALLEWNLSNKFIEIH